MALAVIFNFCPGYNDLQNMPEIQVQVPLNSKLTSPYPYTFPKDINRHTLKAPFSVIFVVLSVLLDEAERRCS